jgi:hypothetical protein
MNKYVYKHLRVDSGFTQCLHTCEYPDTHDQNTIQDYLCTSTHVYSCIDAHIYANINDNLYVLSDVDEHDQKHAKIGQFYTHRYIGTYIHRKNSHLFMYFNFFFDDIGVGMPCACLLSPEISDLAAQLCLLGP